MRFMVHWKLTPEAGTAIEKRPGGPGPVIGRIVERFKPEAMFLAPTRRECWMVVSLSEYADIAEAMITFSELTGEYAEFTPVCTPQEFPAVVAKAMPAARKLVDG
jgi:uncharacterized protein DUF3303